MKPALGRVLFLRTDPGNFDPRIQKETASLVRAGYAVTVFGWDRARAHPVKEYIGEVQYLRSRIPAPYASLLLLLLLPLWWLRAIAVVVSHRPTIVHACDLDALVPALVSRLFVRTSVIYDIFDHFADKLSGVPEGIRNLVRRVDGFLMRRADLIIVTDTHRRAMLPDIGATKVGIIMNVPPLLPDRQSKPLGEGLLRLSYAGVIHDHRGLRVIAAALDGIDGVETTFAGWIPRAIDEDFLRRQSKISYIGKISYPEAIALTERSDIILALYDPALPINRMASSNKVFEAMASGVPVISNDETTMAPLIDELSCGVTIPYGDPRTLREAIVRLRDDPPGRAALGRNGRAAHLREFNWNVMEERLIELYSSIGSNHPVGRGHG